MSDETTNRFTEFDVMAALHQRIAEKKAGASSAQSSTGQGNLDPYQLMLKRKDANVENAMAPIQTWPEEDIKKLEEFCQQHGIMGFNCGHVSPLAALALLKNKLGVIDQATKTEGYGLNYPYTTALQKKQLLKG